MWVVPHIGGFNLFAEHAVYRGINGNQPLSRLGNAITQTGDDAL